MRNRVVAGMCKAVIVVESAVAGGSMITARFAGEQGRQVMAVPGRIDQASNGGCHQLATLMGLELKRLVAKRADGYFEAH